MQKRLILIGQMNNLNDRTLESANRVYSQLGLSPTITTCGGGGLENKFLRKARLNIGNYNTST